MTPIVLTFQRVLYPHLVVQSTHYRSPGAEVPPSPHVDPATYAGLDCLILVGVRRSSSSPCGVFGRLEGNFAEEL